MSARQSREVTLAVSQAIAINLGDVAFSHEDMATGGFITGTCGDDYAITGRAW